jgi:mannose-1-phosphate guanylyltransferase/phosphomannomutase
MMPAVFLDRDGVIIKYVPDICRAEDIELFNFSSEAVKILNRLKFLVIVVTNQPQIAKNYCTEETVKEMNDKMVDELEKEGARIDAVYYCPHHPEKGFPGERAEYKIKCNCRKPKIGMVEEAAKRFNIDLTKSFIIGDETRDIKTGENVKKKYPGFRTILVRTGSAGGDRKYTTNQDFTAETLLDAAKLIKSLVK